MGTSQVGLPFAVIATPFAVVEAKEDPVCGVSSILLDAKSFLHNAFSLLQVLFDDSGTPAPAAAAAAAATAKKINSQVRVQNPPRCSRCQGYINPSVQWTEKGQKWICNLCQMSNQVLRIVFSQEFSFSPNLFSFFRYRSGTSVGLMLPDFDKTG